MPENLFFKFFSRMQWLCKTKKWKELLLQFLYFYKIQLKDNIFEIDVRVRGNTRKRHAPDFKSLANLLTPSQAFKKTKPLI